MFESPKSKNGTEILRLIEHQPLIEILVRTFKGKIKQRRMFFSIRSTSKICFSITESAIRSGIVIKNSKLYSLSTLTEQSFLHTLALSSPQEEEGMASYLYLGDEEKKSASSQSHFLRERGD